MKLGIATALLLAASSLRAAGPAACPAVPTLVPAPAAPAAWDISGNGMLKGVYYFRYVQYTVGDQFGDLSRAVALYQQVRFDGAGTYTISALEMDSNSTQATPCTFNATGPYSISSGGYGFLANPLKPGDLIWGLISQGGVFIGSTTENTAGYNDLFVAAPVGSTASTNATLTGPYSVAYLNFPDGYASNVVAAGFQMNPNGAGGIGPVNMQVYQGTNGAIDVSEQVSYYFSKGAGVLNFPIAGPAIADQEYLYTTADGSLIFGGSPQGFDILVGVRTGTGSAQFSGLYYQAGIDESLSNTSGNVYGSIDSYYGALDVVEGNALIHQRILAPFRPQLQPSDLYALAYNATSAGKIALAFNSGGGYTDPVTGRLYVISADGTMRVGFGVTPALGISIALQAPTAPSPSTSAPYIYPAGVVNAASYAPYTAGVSAGELVAIFGLNFPSQGLQVLVNSVPATVQYSSATQILATLPSSFSGPYSQIQVTGIGMPSNIVWEPVQDTTPGVFSLAEDGLGDALVYNGNGPVNSLNPALPSSTLTLYVTGLGAMSGAFGSSNFAPLHTITATIGGMPANASKPNWTPLGNGVVEMNLLVPTGLGAGENPLTIQGPDSQAAQTTIYVGTASSASQSASSLLRR